MKKDARDSEIKEENSQHGEPSGKDKDKDEWEQE